MKAQNLTAKVRDFATVLAAIDARQVQLATAGQAVEESQLHLVALVRAVEARQTAFIDRTLWQRLRWIVVGR